MNKWVILEFLASLRPGIFDFRGKLIIYKKIRNGVDLQNQLPKIVAVSVFIPLVAYLGFSGQNGNQNGQGQNQNTQGNVPVVPEVNPVWVLSPIFGAVLLLSSWHCARGAQAPAGNLLSSGRLSALRRREIVKLIEVKTNGLVDHASTR
jgi:hypothetical protein